MARSLDFTFNHSVFACELQTVDRSKLYGSVTTDTRDQEGRRCELATLAVDGRTLIPYGGTASGYVNGDGDWISRKNLTAVDSSGDPLETVESSFDQPVELVNSVSLEYFLDHSVRLIYLLKTTDATPDSLLQSLRDGVIYHFEFSYRGGVDTDPAFVLMGEESMVWMLVTEENNIQFVGLEQAAVCTSNASVDIDEADDEQALDFGML